MPPRQDWIKLYTRDMQDPQVRRLSLAQRAIYWQAQLVAKGFSETKGFLVNAGRGMTDDEIAVAMGEFTPAGLATVSEALQAAVEAGLLEWTEHSGYRVVNWDDRQAAELRESRDVVNARKRKQRAAAKKAKPDIAGGRRRR